MAFWVRLAKAVPVAPIDASNLVHKVACSVSSTANGTLTATGISPGATTFIVVPGNYNHYVAVDNINFTDVPEPST